MLSSKTIFEWEDAYEAARKLIINVPQQVELLDHIYNKPKYYSGYYVRTLLCNVKLKGSVPAEQNHSSTVANLGKGSM